MIAIIITIMVLELKIPHGSNFAARLPLCPAGLSYVLSFFLRESIGITIIHYMLHATTEVNGPILWANLHLLFWLSVVPFVTGWKG